MLSTDPSIIVFAIILMISLVVPELAKEAQMITVPFYILGGIVLTHALGLRSFEALEFIGDIGILFLVFIVGLETQEYGNENMSKTIQLSTISAGTCFIFGSVLGHLWGYGVVTFLLLGTILMSSSVCEIIPIVTASGHLREKFSDFLLPSVIVMDAVSLFLLTILLHWNARPLEFALFMAGAIAIIFLIVFFLPGLSRWFFARKRQKPTETDLKFVITVLVISVVIGELIDLHGILTAFLVGAVLGRHIPNEKTHQKLHGFGYGFFIPIFFVVLGMKMDISILNNNTGGLYLIGALVGTLAVSKIVGTMIFARLKGMTSREGMVLGTSLWPQLSATLATAAVGFERGIFDSGLFTAVVLMSVTTALVTPFFVRALVRSEEKDHSMRDHILVVGYGHTSARLAYLLDVDSKDFIVIDRKLSRVRLLKKQGIEAILGSGDDVNALKKANMAHTRIAVITIPDDHEVYLCAKHIKEVNRDCHIIARVHDWSTYERLKDENLIDFAVWPEKLSSEIIIKHMIDSQLWGDEAKESFL